MWPAILKMSAARFLQEAGVAGQRGQAGQAAPAAPQGRIYARSEITRMASLRRKGAINDADPWAATGSHW
jgi:hypothetical protein